MTRSSSLADVQGASVENLLRATENFCQLRENVSPSLLTTFGVGAPLPLLLKANSPSGFIRTLSLLHSAALDFELLGGGSNIILPDSPLERVVVQFGKPSGGVATFRSLEEAENYAQSIITNEEHPAVSAWVPKDDEPVFIFVEAGVPLMSLSRQICQQGLSGLEFAAGIPATIGGAVCLNAGAHDHSISDITSRVLVTDRKGSVSILDNLDCGFGYRESRFGKNLIVLGAILALRKGDKAEIERKKREFLDFRKETQPLQASTFGSVFRNPGLSSNLAKEAEPEAKAAAWLIEQVGMKGYTRHSVRVSPTHANWFERVSQNASADDALWLIEEIKAKVFDRFGIELICEVKTFS